MLATRFTLSQTGLSGILALFVAIKLVARIVPRRYLDRHIIQVKDVVAMNLSPDEIVQIQGKILCLVAK